MSSIHSLHQNLHSFLGYLGSMSVQTAQRDTIKKCNQIAIVQKVIDQPRFFDIYTYLKAQRNIDIELVSWCALSTKYSTHTNSLILPFNKNYLPIQSGKCVWLYAICIRFNALYSGIINSLMLTHFLVGMMQDKRRQDNLKIYLFQVCLWDFPSSL